MQLSYRRLLGLATLILTLGCLLGCGDEEEGGSAPILSDLTYSPLSVETGTTSRVACEFIFFDPDADVVRVHLDVDRPNGDLYIAESVEIEHVTDQPDGFVTVELEVTPTVPGTYTLRLEAQDKAGNKSNTLVALLDAYDP